MFSGTFAIGNSKIRIRQIHRGNSQTEKSKNGTKYIEGINKKKARGLTVARDYHPPGSLLHEAVDESLNEPNIKVKSSMARSLPVENLLPQDVGVNYQLLAVMC